MTTTVNDAVTLMSDRDSIVKRLTYRTALDKEDCYRFPILSEEGIPQRGPLLSTV